MPSQFAAARAYSAHKLHHWFESEESPHRILSMEGLRGLAILLVFLCHFQIVILGRLAATFHSRFFLTAAQIGGTGVDLFFILSGMLIYRAAMRPRLHYGQFMLRRVQRIYPTFFVVLLLYVVLSMVFHLGEHFAATGLQAKILYLLQNLFLLPGIVNLPPIISAAWSLSYEFCFYLVVPIFVRLFAVPSWRRQSRAGFWAVILLAYLLFVALKPGFFPQSPEFDGSYVRFTLFLCGMVIEEVLASKRGLTLLTRNAQWSLLALGAVALCLLLRSEWLTVGTPSHDLTGHAATRAACVIVLYTSLVLAALRPDGVLTPYFSTRSLRWTGNISYSFYLIHGFSLNVFAVIVAHLAWARRHPVAVSPILLLLAIGGTFLASTVLFLAVEKPFSLRRSQKRPAPPTPYPAGTSLREPT